MNIEPERLKAIQDACEIVLFENQALEMQKDNIYLVEECIRVPSFLVACSKETIEIQVQLRLNDHWYYDLDEPTGNRAFMFIQNELKVRSLPCGNLRVLVRAYKNCTPFIGIYQPFAEDIPNKIIKEEYNRMLQKTEKMIDADNKELLDYLKRDIK